MKHFFMAPNLGTLEYLRFSECVLAWNREIYVLAQTIQEVGHL